MKIYITLSIIICLFWACEKDNKKGNSITNLQDISYYEIGKVVTLGKPDSISVSGNYVHLNIEKYNSGDFNACIFYDTINNPTSNSGSQILVVESGEVASLSEGYELNKDRNWGGGCNRKITMS